MLDTSADTVRAPVSGGGVFDDEEQDHQQERMKLHRIQTGLRGTHSHVARGGKF